MIIAFNMTNLLTVFFLIFLEGALSLDNALALALMVRHLPEQQQKRALTWGIWGAFGFRFLALFFLTTIMSLTWIKVLGATYLFWIALKGLVSEPGEDPESQVVSSFGLWRTILAVELVDISFSADSILAAVSLTQSYWIVILGGILGIAMMRFATILIIRLMRMFPRLERTAFMLIFVIAFKLLMEASQWGNFNFHSSSSPESWLFWFSMVGCLVYGFSRKSLRAAGVK